MRSTNTDSLLSSLVPKEEGSDEQCDEASFGNTAENSEMAYRRYEGLPDVLNTQEVAFYLGVHVKTVREYIRFGKIRALTIGKYYRIRKEWVTEFLEQKSNSQE